MGNFLFLLLQYYTAVADDTPRVVVTAHDDLRLRIMFEGHDAPSGGHRGRENTDLSVSCNFYCPRQFQLVPNYIRSCEVCQLVKPSSS